MASCLFDLAKNRFTYLHILGANQLHNICKCATHFHCHIDFIADPGQGHKNTWFSACLLYDGWFCVCSIQPKLLHPFPHTWCQPVALSMHICNMPFVFTMTTLPIQVMVTYKQIYNLISGRGGHKGRFTRCD